jgi:hypothetical protein
MGKNMKVDLQELGTWSMDWIDLARAREVVSTCKCEELSCCIKYGEFLD